MDRSVCEHFVPAGLPCEECLNLPVTDGHGRIDHDDIPWWWTDTKSVYLQSLYEETSEAIICFSDCAGIALISQLLKIQRKQADTHLLYITWPRPIGVWPKL